MLESLSRVLMSGQKAEQRYLAIEPCQQQNVGSSSSMDSSSDCICLLIVVKSNMQRLLLLLLHVRRGSCLHSCCHDIILPPSLRCVHLSNLAKLLAACT